MYSFLLPIALTFLCLGDVTVHAHPAELETGQQDTHMQYLDGFKLTQLEEQDQVMLL